MPEILNRYGRVGEIFHALIQVAPSDEIKDGLVEFALGVYSDQTEEEATSIEAELVRSILARKRDATSDGRLAIQTVTEEMNFDRGDKDKLNPKSIGRITNRLGFKKARMPDAKGNRALLLDDDLIDQLVSTYDINNVAVESFPKETSERQNARKEGLYTLGPGHSDISGAKESGAPEYVRTAPTTLISDVSDILTSAGGDAPFPVEETRNKVDSLLKKDPRPYLATPQVAYHLGISVSQARNILGSLEKLGRVSQTKPDCWSASHSPTERGSER